MASVSAKDPVEVVSLGRGLQILRSFRALDAPLGNKEIAERTQLPKATVARLTYTLCKMGYLRQIGPHGQFHLADKVTGLGHSLLRTLSVRQIADPLMQELADRFEMSVALGIGDGADMVYLNYCSGPETVTMRLRVGSLIPIAHTAMGRSYMWGLAEPARRHHMEMIRRSVGPEKAEGVEETLTAEIQSVEEKGFSVSFGDWRRQIYAVGAPVWLDNGETVLALNCGTRAIGLDRTRFPETLGPELILVSNEISHRMSQLGATFWSE